MGAMCENRCASSRIPGKALRSRSRRSDRGVRRVSLSVWRMIATADNRYRTRVSDARAKSSGMKAGMLSLPFVSRARSTAGAPTTGCSCGGRAVVPAFRPRQWGRLGGGASSSSEDSDRPIGSSAGGSSPEGAKYPPKARRIQVRDIRLADRQEDRVGDRPGAHRRGVPSLPHSEGHRRMGGQRGGMRIDMYPRHAQLNSTNIPKIEIPYI